MAFYLIRCGGTAMAGRFYLSKHTHLEKNTFSIYIAFYLPNCL